MNNPKKFPIGAALYWVSLALCALVVSANGFSFAGNGSIVSEDQPCIVTNANCPKCSSMFVTYKAYYNMAGETVFRTEEKTGGDYHLNGVDYIPCYKYAECNVSREYVNRRCDLAIGCVDGGSFRGCRDLVQGDWITEYKNRERWGKISEE